MRIRGNPWVRAIDRWIGSAIVAVLGLFKGKGKPLDGRIPHKILLVKLNALGDTLMFLTAARALKDRWPEAEITYLGSTLNVELLQRDPILQRLKILDLSRIMRSPLYLLNFVRDLRKDHYDLVIDGSQWERIAAMLVGMTRSDFRIGFRTPGQWKHTVYHVPIPHRRDRHEMHCFHDLLEPLGIKVSKQVRPWLLVEDHDRSRLDALLNGSIPANSTILLIHPGCGEHGQLREWPLDYYRELGQRWLNSNPGGWIVISGTGGEVAMCENLKNQLPGRAMSLAGSLDIGTSSALLERTSILVSGNTGIIHMASAFETPSVAIHGPTDPVKWGPYNRNAIVLMSPLECAPCLYLGHEYDCDCPKCMEAIPVDTVWQAVMEVEKVAVNSQ
jgi:heptosyltransferase-3